MKVVRTLREEIITRFPEVSGKIDDPDDGPYTGMHEIVDWLRGLPREAITADIIDRVRAFQDWCFDQPRTESAKDDIFTIFIVGFQETLFESSSTRKLIPHLMTREELLANRTYVVSWCGEDNYNLALEEFDQFAKDQRQAQLLERPQRKKNRQRKQTDK